MSEERRIVVVGAGHAGVQVAANLRHKGWQEEIVLIDSERGIPYERPPLSKEALKSAEPESVRSPLRKPHFYVDLRIDLRDGVGVERIHPESRFLMLSDGTELEYHKLVLATGARARVLDIPGKDLRGVQTLRSHQDAFELHERLLPGRKVVIVGAGYIGMEVAAAARERGAEVTVIEFQDRVMSRVTSEPVSQFFTRLHEEQGVRFVFSESVTAIEGRDGEVVGVRGSHGASYPADIVVIGVGIQPNSELAVAAGIEQQDGILVDGRGRTNVADIFAAGDVARFPGGWDGGQIRLECIQNAMDHADLVASEIMGAVDESPAGAPWFWTVQHGVRLQTAGLWDPGDQRVLRTHPRERSFSVLYLRDGMLAAIDTVGALSDFTAAKRIIQARQYIDAVLAADPTVKLADAVVTPLAI